jgi:hypothetical protein
VARYVTRIAVAMVRLGKHVRGDVIQQKLYCERCSLWIRSDQPGSVQRVSAVQLSVELWSVNQRVTEAEDSLPGNI